MVKTNLVNGQTITVKNSSAECAALHEFLILYIKKNNISTDVIDDLRLVIEETFINIISYAYPSGTSQAVNIEFSHTSHRIEITFSDTGIKFNPLTHNSNNLGSNNLETDDFCDGGMGIHLIKSLTDEQHYERVKQHNVFTVTKHYTK